ncbi:Major facilitator superfamily domain, general substrate transporter [Metarhizium album ARSEF 1941]|uniref:Major facilitator superfamily domain, general substrate transporter n=1 Tax=Metarhizium album (strain ARSEF 1941) TaxID=1081103 RepID=A0A0B2X156_METAS|nr:Major facilitator superfamily domain, general substrate transporter [Metarhizium album ARSEF 1941]KHN98785.1 Major facilitator superfamily domain, general substrate transporter [Metarhizium album ARSEF 1941]
MSSTSEDLKGTASPWKRLFGVRAGDGRQQEKQASSHSRWSFGVLNDRQTVEVPGSVLLLAANRNEPLGLREVHARTSHSSIPTGFFVDMPLTPGGSRPVAQGPPATKHVDPNEGKKKTQDGAIILDPQPEDSVNDPLNWPAWRRDTALLSLGFYCMIGGGITSIMAAGFTDIAHDMDVEVETVSLTVGLYMMGLGVGSVFASPTAILFGKRPVYLASVILFIATCIWGGYSPSFPSLLAARVFQGVAISPVECLPSATIAEIFFLHERAYRIGIYTLLLLGGKNLIPLVSAAIIGRYGWRWVFFIVAMVAGSGFILLFLFVPETFWDRTPRRKPSKRPSFLRRLSSRRNVHIPHQATQSARNSEAPERPPSLGAETRQRGLHVGFAYETAGTGESQHHVPDSIGHLHPDSAGHHVGFASSRKNDVQDITHRQDLSGNAHGQMPAIVPSPSRETPEHIEAEPSQLGTNAPLVHVPEEHCVMDETSSVHSPIRSPRSNLGQSPGGPGGRSPYLHSANQSDAHVEYFSHGPNLDNERIPASILRSPPRIKAYTHNLRHQPAQTFTQQLKPYHGRLNNDKWFKVMIRPFVLFSYPAVLWSAAVYSCSIGWLIVISETMAVIYRDPASYNFNALQTGLVYVSPFVGGVLGTGVAGKISDLIVRAMSRRNGGMYEPEFRLVMAIPIMLTTCIGLMGFGWSAQEKDHWMIPTAFFGILSFGCSLGSTTAITFCVDSYRQYAGEALVTLNFSKNVLHGLVFSLFVTHWMASDGPKQVYMWLGIMQLLIHLTTIPLFIFGKRARMWTVRMNLMEKF